MGGGGKRAAGSRGMAVAPTTVGTCKRQKADAALKSRVAAMVAQNGGGAGGGAIISKGTIGKEARSPEGTSRPPRGVAGDNPAATMRRYQQMTALGMQTVQLVSIPQRKHIGGGSNSSLDAKNAQNNGQYRSIAPHRPPKTSPGGLNMRKSPIRPPVAAKQRLKGTFYGTAQPPPGRRRIRTVDDDPDSDLDSFLDDGDGDDVISPGGGNWRSALREALGGYDPSRYADVDAQNDRDMHASYNQIAAEEARAAKIAREIDRQEALKEAEERAAKLKKKREKEARRKKKAAEGVIDSESDDDDDEDSDHDDGFVENENSSSEDEDFEGREAKKKRKRMAGLLASF